MPLPSSVATRLQCQHDSLLDIVEGLSDEQVRRRVDPEKWSIFENTVHLQTYQHTMTERVRKMLKGNNPSFDAYTAAADPLFHDNCKRTTPAIVEDLRTVRRDMAAHILALDEAALDKTGQHPTYGKMKLVQWLNFFLLHEAHHLFAIFKLTARLRDRSERG